MNAQLPDSLLDAQRVRNLDPAGVKIFRLWRERLAVYCEHDRLRNRIHAFLSAMEDSEAAPTGRLVILGNHERKDMLPLLMCSPEHGLSRIAATPLKAWLSFRRLYFQLALGAVSAQLCILHGFVVSRGSTSVALVLGSSGAGKTTTLLSLLEKEFSFVCEDFIPVYPANGEVVAFPIGATVTPETLRRFPRLLPLVKDVLQTPSGDRVESTADLSALFSTARPYSRMNPKAIYFLTPRFGEASAIVAVGKEKAQWRIRLSSFDSSLSTGKYFAADAAENERMFRAASRLLEKVKCFEVFNGQMPDTAELIASSFDEILRREGE